MTGQSNDVPQESPQGYEIAASEKSAPTGTAPHDLAASDGQSANAQLWQEGRQFSLVGLLAAVTLVALLLGVMQWLPRPVFAGAMGIGCLLLLVAQTFLDDHRAVLRLGWWLVFATYLLAAFLAVIE